MQAQAQTSPAPPGSSSPTMPAAGNPAQAATTSEPAVTDAPLILVVGDSLSAEYGLSRGTGWVAQMQKRLEDGELTASVVNASISGDTTAGGLSRLPALLEDHHPDVVIIELGGNDALRGLPLNLSAQNLTSMVEQSQEAGAEVILVGMQIPPNYGPAYARQFEALFAQVAQQTNSRLVPFLLEGIATDAASFQADGIHPTEEAQAVMLDNVWPVLHEVLNEL